MSTPSRIAMKTKEGYRSIYCHWDGHLYCNGTTLLLHYNNQEKVERLLAMGNCSELGRDIGTKHDFGCNERPEGQCTFYSRDRGDKEQDALVDKSVVELAKTADDCAAFFVYLWKNGRWYFAPTSTRSLRWRPLTALAILEIKNCPCPIDGDMDAALIAADWLEEHGRVEEANKIREFFSGTAAESE